MIRESTNRPELHHHSLARFELAHFCRPNGELWLYDRKDNAYRSLAPPSVMVEKDYNTYADRAGKVYRVVERAISTIEGIAKPILEKLNEGNIELNLQEQSDFAYFMVLKWVRTPATKQRLEAALEAAYKSTATYFAANADRFASILADMEERSGMQLDDDDMDREELQRSLLSEEYNLIFPRMLTLKHMLFLLDDLWPQVMDRRWIFGRAKPNRGFVNSDNPIVLHQLHPLPAGVGSLPPGILTPWAQTITPLTPRLCFILDTHSTGDREAYDLSEKMIRFINDEVALNSQRFVIAQNEQLLRSVATRTAINSKKPRSFSVEISPGPTSTSAFFQVSHK